MQYLITTFTDSAGVQHNHVTKARENQTFTVVEAESKSEALEVYGKPKVHYTRSSRVVEYNLPNREILKNIFRDNYLNKRK